MKKTIEKLLDDDKVKNLEITTKIRSKTTKMIDKFFETKNKSK